jgi:hypothetical protein
MSESNGHPSSSWLFSIRRSPKRQIVLRIPYVYALCPISIPMLQFLSKQARLKFTTQKAEDVSSKERTASSATFSW